MRCSLLKHYYETSRHGPFPRTLANPATETATMAESREAQLLAASLRQPLGHVPAAGVRSNQDRFVGAPYSTGPVSWADEKLAFQAQTRLGTTAFPAKQRFASRPGTSPAVLVPENSVAAALGGSVAPTAWSAWRQEAAEAQYPG